MTEWNDHTFREGYKFSMLQPSATPKPRRYTVCFTVTPDFKAAHTGGTRPRPETQKRANDYVRERALKEGLL